MKFSCTRENLARILSIAEKFTGKNISLPVLGNILLETEVSSLKVSATNLEYAIEIKVPGEVSRQGKASVPAKIINQLVQSMGDEKLEIEEKQKNLFLKTPSREVKINGLPAEDFPLIPKIKKTFSFTAGGEEFRKAMERVLPSVSASEFKPELTGVFFRLDSKNLKLAATDTFRLAEESLGLEAREGDGAFSFILPQRTAQELARILSEGYEEVKAILGENQSEFRFSNARMVSRLIEGNFPEYAAIIPKNFETSAYLNRKEFTDAVRASAIFASKLQEVTLRLFGKALEITSANPEVGEYKNKIPAAVSGPETKISFNFRYLLDGLGALEEEEIFLGVNAAEGPAMLRNRSSGNFLYVLMPLRLT